MRTRQCYIITRLTTPALCWKLHVSPISQLKLFTLNQSGPLSLVEECRGSALIGREDHSVDHWVFACSSLVLYGIRDRWLPCTERSYYRRPYAIKNQRRSSKDPSRGLCVPKPLVGGFGCPSWFFMAKQS